VVWFVTQQWCLGVLLPLLCPRLVGTGGGPRGGGAGKARHRSRVCDCQCNGPGSVEWTKGGHKGAGGALGVVRLRQPPRAVACAAFGPGFWGGETRGGPSFFTIHPRGVWCISTAFFGGGGIQEVALYSLSYVQGTKKVRLIARSPSSWSWGWSCWFS